MLNRVNIFSPDYKKWIWSNHELSNNTIPRAKFKWLLLTTQVFLKSQMPRCGQPDFLMRQNRAMMQITTEMASKKHTRVVKIPFVMTAVISFVIEFNYLAWNNYTTLSKLSTITELLVTVDIATVNSNTFKTYAGLYGSLPL